MSTDPPTSLWTMPQGSNRGINRVTLQAQPDLSAANVVWIGSAFEGLYRLDVASQQLVQDSSLGRPIFSIWAGLEPDNGGQRHVTYAGTNDGVYRRINGGGWHNLHTSVAAGVPDQESLVNTTVIALEKVDGKLLAATTQRGLWAFDPASGWTRLTVGLPRTGRLVDIPGPASLAGWTAQFSSSNALSLGDSASHVIYLPVGSPIQRLDLTRNTPDVSVTLYHVAPFTSLRAFQWAGLQELELTLLPPGINSFRASGPIHEGFYVLVVRAETDISGYTITASVV